MRAVLVAPAEAEVRTVGGGGVYAARFQGCSTIEALPTAARSVARLVLELARRGGVVGSVWLSAKNRQALPAAASMHPS